MNKKQMLQQVRDFRVIAESLDSDVFAVETKLLTDVLIIEVRKVEKRDVFKKEV